MKLYYCDVLAPRKACAVAKYLKSPVEFIYLDLTRDEHLTPAMLAINPNGKVPTLVDGGRTLWEADAIMCHLSERMGANLWPRDRSQQLQVIQWFSWNAAHFIRAGGNLYFEYVIKPRFGKGPPDLLAVEEALREFRRCAAILNTNLKGRQWLLGEALSVADFSVAVTLPYARQASLPLDEFPELLRWHEQLNAFEAWREPFPIR
jgi:glutathione S-transferase